MVKINFLNFSKTFSRRGIGLKIKKKNKEWAQQEKITKCPYKSDDVHLLGNDLYKDYPPMGIVLLNKNIPINKVDETIVKMVTDNVEFDFKKVGETINNNIYLFIRGPHKYSGVKKIVVPYAYALIKEAAKKYKKQDWVLIIMPINKELLFTVIKNGEIVYTRMRDVSITSDLPEKVIETIISIIDDVKTYYITANISLISFLQINEELNSEIIRKLNELNIKFIIDDVKISCYDDVLTINQQYAYKYKIIKSIDNVISRLLSQTFKTDVSLNQIITYILVFFTAFSWVYFPLNNVLSYMSDQYKIVNREIVSDINNINISKKVFADAVKTFKDKESLVQVYNKTIQPPPLQKYEKLFELIENNAGGNIVAISLNGYNITISVKFANTNMLDNYIKKLLMSGMFQSLEPTPRMNKPFEYSIQGVLNKKYFSGGKV